MKNPINMKYYYIDDVRTNLIGIDESKNYCRPMFWNSDEVTDNNKLVTLRTVTTERGEKIKIESGSDVLTSKYLS